LKKVKYILANTAPRRADRHKLNTSLRKLISLNYNYVAKPRDLKNISNDLPVGRE